MAKGGADGERGGGAKRDVVGGADGEREGVEAGAVEGEADGERGEVQVALDEGEEWMAEEEEVVSSELVLS